MLALFTVIEANRKDSSMASSSKVLAKTNIKGKRELQWLACSTNYDAKRGTTTKDNGKGRGFRVLNDGQNFILECEETECRGEEDAD